MNGILYLLLFFICIVSILTLILTYKFFKNKNQISIFILVFVYSLLTLLITSNYDLFGQYPQIIPYGNMIYRYIEPFIKLINIIASALIGSVVYFYISEYKIFLRNRRIYIRLIRNLSKVIKDHVYYINKCDLLKEKDIKKIQTLSITTFHLKDLSETIRKVKIVKKILDNNNLIFSSDAEMKGIISNKTGWEMRYKNIEKDYYKLEVNFKIIEDKIIDILSEDNFKRLLDKDEESLNCNDDFTFVCTVANFRAIYQPHFKKILNLYIELLELLERPIRYTFSNL